MRDEIVQDTHGDFFPGHQQQTSVFAPLLETSQGPPAENAYYPAEPDIPGNQLQFMTESKVLEGVHMPHADNSAAAADGPAMPAMSAPHPEAANGFVGGQSSNGPVESRSERGRSGVGGRGGGGYCGSGGSRGRGPQRGGRGGAQMGGRGGAETGGRNGPGDFHRGGSRGGGGGGGNRNMRGGRGGRGPPPGMMQPPQHVQAYAT